MASGAAPSSASARRSARSTWIPQAAIQRYKLDSALDWVKAVVLPEGCAMNQHAVYTPSRPRSHGPARLDVLVARTPFVFSVHPARVEHGLAVASFIVVLLLLVRAVSGGDAAYQQFLEWTRHRGRAGAGYCRFAFVCSARRDLVQPGAPGDGGAHRRAARAGMRTVRRRTTRRWPSRPQSSWRCCCGGGDHGDPTSDRADALAALQRRRRDVGAVRCPSSSSCSG